MSSAAKPAVASLDAAGGRRQSPAAAAHRVRSARQRARRAPLEELMPGTLRAYRASDPASAIPVTASSAGTGVPAARWPQMKVDRARRIDNCGAAGSAARPRAKLLTKFL